MAGSNEISNYLTEFNDNYWLIGFSDIAKSQIYLVGWEFTPDGITNWSPKHFNPWILTGDEIEGKGCAEDFIHDKAQGHSFDTP